MSSLGPAQQSDALAAAQRAGLPLRREGARSADEALKEAVGYVRGREGRAGAHMQQQFAPSQILSGEAARLLQRPVPPAPARPAPAQPSPAQSSPALQQGRGPACLPLLRGRVPSSQ